MATSSEVLAKFAAELQFSDLPPQVLARAKDCIIDTVAVMRFGAQFPWSRITADYARRYGSGGPCTLVGSAGPGVQAPYAALANAVAANSFELDSARNPGVGAHPGATLLPAVLAACEDTGADCRAAITALVAGCEVFLRIALASHHHPEQLGFHAPGLTGPYGAAIAAGRIYGLDAEQLANALGIAGSLSSGLLAFTHSKHGGMVKRLHLGRSAESGVLAARLAATGYTGPETVLEGKFGFLEVYCKGGEAALLTAGLHQEWETLRIGLKLYPYHVAAHPAVEALRELMAKHAFDGSTVAGLVVEGNDKLVNNYNIPEPGDLVQAQHSVPFCMALALFRNPDDPKSFDDSALKDPALRAACRAVELRATRPNGTRIMVRLKDGREFVAERAPDAPLTEPERKAALRRKFMLLNADLGEANATVLYERLGQLETQSTFPLG